MRHVDDHAQALVLAVERGRPGHDFRYEITPSHAEVALGWRPRHDFETGLRRTVQWYLDHRDWWTALQARRGRMQPLGPLPTEAAA